MKGFGDAGEAVGGPAFIFAVGSGIEEDEGAVNPEYPIFREEKPGGFLVFVIGEVEFEGGVEIFLAEGETGEVKVILDGRRGDVGYLDIEGVGQKEAAAIAFVADANGGTGEAGSEGGAETVGEKEDGFGMVFFYDLSRMERAGKPFH